MVDLSFTANLSNFNKGLIFCFAVICLMFGYVLFDFIVLKTGQYLRQRSVEIIFSLQFTLEDARERLSALNQSPDRRQRLEPGSAREQRHSIHVLTSQAQAAHGEYYKKIEALTQ